MKHKVFHLKFYNGEPEAPSSEKLEKLLDEGFKIINSKINFTTSGSVCNTYQSGITYILAK